MSEEKVKQIVWPWKVIDQITPDGKYVLLYDKVGVARLHTKADADWLCGLLNRLMVSPPDSD